MMGYAKEEAKDVSEGYLDGVSDVATKGKSLTVTKNKSLAVTKNNPHCNLMAGGAAFSRSSRSG